MHTRSAENNVIPTCCNLKQLFRLRFQRALTDFLFHSGSAAEGFGIVWEKTLERVPLDEVAQAEVYRELITWAKGDELFTAPGADQLLAAWRQTVHDL